MKERIVGLSLEEVWNEFRRISLSKGCKIVEEKATDKIVLEHGSFWNGGKRIEVHFFSHGTRGSRIVGIAKLLPSYQIYVATSILLTLIIGFFLWWLVLDMRAYIEGVRSSLGGRILEFFGYTKFREALSFIDIIEKLTLFILIFCPIMEIIQACWYYVKRESILDEIFAMVPDRVPMKSEIILCPNCGEKNRQDSLYCTKCGKPLREN